MIFGRLIGVILGGISGGFLGAIIGYFVGGLFDRALRKFQQSETPEALAAIQATFFNTTFTLIGYLAKADGRVSEEEVKQTEQLMGQMGLTADHKREAIALFKAGSAPDFDPQATLQTFREICGKRAQLSRMLMIYLINTAVADGQLDSSEESALRRVAEGLQFPNFVFEQLLKMVKAQGSFSGGGQSYSGAGQASAADELANAYEALGMTPSATDAELKKAYRKLMSEYHPDKLIGQGVPDDMIKAATERSQQVQAAYDVIKRTRKG